MLTLSLLFAITITVWLMHAARRHRVPDLGRVSERWLTEDRTSGGR